MWYLERIASALEKQNELLEIITLSLVSVGRKSTEDEALHIKAVKLLKELKQ